MSFVHLHTHSEYSLLDGANRIEELVAQVKRLGMDSLAVTDHGNLHAAWDFYETAKAQKIRPILGFEAYLAFGPRQAREKPAWAPAPYSHLVLLARNRTGYKNLIHLSSIGYTEGFYRRPRIDKDVLAEHSEGVMCLAACLSGEVSLYLRQGKYDEARRSAEWFAHTFGSRDAEAGRGSRSRRRRHERRPLPAPGGRRGARRAARDRHRGRSR
jgi:DNA polymerase-3 subunit alpha